MPNFQSAQPSRFISGFTQAMDFQPMGGVGAPDPFFWAMFEDDFLPYNAGNYTITTNNGSVAPIAGPGGLIAIASGTTLNGQPTLQNNIADFALQSTNRLFYGCRISMSGVGNQGLVAGLINTTGTPFTGGSITDGIYFNIPVSTSTLSLLTLSGGVSTGSVNLSSVFTPTSAVYFDLAFMYAPYSSVGGNIAIWAGSNLWGNKSVGQNAANLGPVGRLIPTVALTSANLSMTLATQTPSTTSYALNADFHVAALER